MATGLFRLPEDALLLLRTVQSPMQTVQAGRLWKMFLQGSSPFCATLFDAALWYSTYGQYHRKSRVRTLELVQECCFFLFFSKNRGRGAFGDDWERLNCLKCTSKEFVSLPIVWLRCALGRGSH